MNKEKYKPTELEITKFETEDMITTSGEVNPHEDDPHEYESPIVPLH